MPTPNEFELRLAVGFSPAAWYEVGVLVAYSAGPDSTALLSALTALCPIDAKHNIVAAHFNHRLRGADSDDDERHAVALAERLGVECVVERGDTATAAAARGDGLEEAARDQRYRFFTATAAKFGFRYVVTAHTLDDQAETVLLRLLRGTGIVGLAGIPRARSLADGAIGLVRPMLGFRRAEVLDYLRDRDLPYRVDASNADSRFTRNRLRNELLPQLARDYNPQVVEALARLAGQADELRDVVGELIAPLVAKSVRSVDDGTIEIDCRSLAGLPRHLVRETLAAAWRDAGWPQQAMGFADWNRLATLVTESSPAAIVLAGSIRAQKTGASLMLTRPSV